MKIPSTPKLPKIPFYCGDLFSPRGEVGMPKVGITWKWIAPLYYLFKRGTTPSSTSHLRLSLGMRMREKRKKKSKKR